MILKKIKNFSINFGPQHPSAHGVLRLMVHLHGEFITKLDPHIGLLHRGTEKLIETKNFLQALPYFDRLDYVSTMSQEHVFSSLIELFLQSSLSLKIHYIRILFLEITRILNHLMAITTHALDLGALTPFLWGFELRETLMEFFEKVSGARLHTAYIIPGGVSGKLPKSLVLDLGLFTVIFDDNLDEIEYLLTDNFIWKYRLKFIGKFSKKLAKAFSLSGVLARSTGLSIDLRDICPYERYWHINFQFFVSKLGDSFDRYILRIIEMRESNRIVQLCLIIIYIFPHLFYTDFNFKLKNNFKLSQSFLKENMEAMIIHFILNTKCVFFETNSNYLSAETPKGEFGVYMIVQKQNSFLFRCKIRAPGFFHLQSLNILSKNLMLADLVTLIGTQDIVFGEIDR